MRKKINTQETSERIRVKARDKKIIVFWGVRPVYQVIRCHIPENRNDLVSED